MSIATKQSLRGRIAVSSIVKDDLNTIILVDESGNEVPAVLVDGEVELTATVNDIRIGTTAVTSEGVVTGEKEIPPYHTTAGWRLVTDGSEYSIPLITRDAFDYTALQCVICPFVTDAASSVSSDKVVIENKVYPVNSSISLSTVIKDADNKSVRLGVTNESGAPSIIRYFTYKEEQ